MRTALWSFAFIAIGLIGTSAAFAQHQATDADFPPGVFTDNGHYSLPDFQGKILVLFLYDQDCPTCRGHIPVVNQLVEQFKDAPVKFIAVSPDASLMDARGYLLETKLAMPVFVDTFDIMESRYREKISLENIFQFKVIGPDGNVIDQFVLDSSNLENDVKQVKWKYKDDGYDPQLNRAVMLFEWNQFDAGMQELRPFRKSSTKTLAASAEKLYQAVKTEGGAWKDQADQSAADDPVKAYDLYTRISSVFRGDDLAKAADEALKALKTNKAVTDELAARAMYSRVDGAVAKARANQKADIATYCNSIAEAYPGTPTGAKAAQLAKELTIPAILR